MGFIVFHIHKSRVTDVRFSWEYPNKQGIGCNVISPNDSSNFLLLLQEMNTNNAFNNIKITAAVGMAPFAGPDGTPMSDVSAFAKVIDHICESPLGLL